MNRQDIRNRRPTFTCGTTAPAKGHARIDGMAIVAALVLVVISVCGLSILWGAL